MKRFTALPEFDAHIAESSYPSLLILSAREHMKTVEECNQGGAQSALIIAETPEDRAALETEYGLLDMQPEDFSIFGTECQVWHEEVYVLGDDGGGVVVYTRMPQR